ncbi:iron(III) transport system ATP-binding protein [Mesorhizobium soli]|uniref:ABC transporter ATP-binding protein n=1 Tax=Pseudaminobacter soli (ex Li et al. 2025) TaxID=1295366 RepID=UPI002476CE04|nr:ABC transporter ATP-binding protein [Mesorhizobium soli]MDH6233815.1 iron(III) transport system ATP-binding protein [Mesorhizobium soli]
MSTAERSTEGLAIQLRDLALSFGETPILRGVSLDLARGRTLALLGSSGCGKTTLLRLLAGLLFPTTGSVSIDGRQMADAATGHFVPPERRRLGMVFQDYALWPHMSVAGNVAFPLEMAGVGRVEINRRVGMALHRVGLADLAARSPGELSGGQQQRVAIARAIVGEPKLVLFDEPLSNLDRELRESLAVDLAQLLSDLSISAVYVTHDQGEAFTIADEVAVMQRGQIIQLSDPQSLVEGPASAEVAEFLKLGTVVQAERQGGSWALAGTGIRLAMGSEGPADANRARVMLGRKALRVHPEDEAQASGQVVRALFRGDFYALSVALGDDGGRVEVEAVSEFRRSVGDRVGLSIEPVGLRWFPAI